MDNAPAGRRGVGDTATALSGSGPAQGEMEAVGLVHTGRPFRRRGCNKGVNLAINVKTCAVRWMFLAAPRGITLEQRTEITHYNKHTAQRA